MCSMHRCSALSCKAHVHEHKWKRQAESLQRMLSKERATDKWSSRKAWTCCHVRTQEEMTAEIGVSCGNYELTQVPPAAPCSCHKADFVLWHISLPHCLTLKSPFTSVFLEPEGLGQSQVHLEQIPAFPSIIKQRRRKKFGGRPGWQRAYTKPWVPGSDTCKTGIAPVSYQHLECRGEGTRTTTPAGAIWESVANKTRSLK